MNHRLVRQWKLPDWVGVVWASLMLLLSIAVAVTRSLDESTSKDSIQWIRSEGLKAGLAIGLAVTVAIDSSRRLISKLGSRGETRAREGIRKAMRTAISVTIEVTALPPQHIGCSLYMVHNSRRRGERLLRVERERLLNKQISGVELVPGMGAVGMCWEQQHPELQDWREVNARFYPHRPDADTWMALPPVEKGGFDYVNWRKIVFRYAEVLALPVMVGGKMVGCIALDRTWDPNNNDSASPPLFDARVEAILDTAADAVAVDLGKLG